MTFQVVVEDANGMYVALGPFSPEDELAMLPDYVVHVIDDDDKQDWLIENVNWPQFAHLGLDGQTFDLLDEWPT